MSLRAEEVPQRYINGFWDKVDMSKPDGCWLWLGAKAIGGQGYYHINGYKQERERVHKIAYVLVNGDIPDNRRLIHTCGNKDCVNPNHLTFAQEVLISCQSDFTPEQEEDIKVKVQLGVKLSDIAREYGVSRQCISQIKKRSGVKSINDIKWGKTHQNV